MNKELLEVELVAAPSIGFSELLHKLLQRRSTDRDSLICTDIFVQKIPGFMILAGEIKSRKTKYL